jgi:predicted translin family RNA/ssDNA-binding protein
MILLVYSFLEGYLEDLAFICTKQFRDNIKDKTLGISIDIERSKAQIENLSKCSFDAYEKEWKKIHLYREVRNCILHYNSNIARMNKKAFINSSKTQ